LGCFAPAARHVQDPSLLLLVNSISIRRDMRRTRYRAWGPSKVRTGFWAVLTRCGHPVLWPGV
jgi:hypothetical protein